MINVSSEHDKCNLVYQYDYVAGSWRGSNL